MIFLIAPEVSLVLDSCKAPLSPPFAYCNSCSVKVATRWTLPDAARTRGQDSSILKVPGAKYQPKILYPAKKALKTQQSK